MRAVELWSPAKTEVGRRERNSEYIDGQWAEAMQTPSVGRLTARGRKEGK